MDTRPPEMHSIALHLHADEEKPSNRWCMFRALEIGYGEAFFSHKKNE